VDEERKERVLAVMLRKRLEGRCPVHILAGLSDHELVQKYENHHSTRVALVRERAATATKRNTVGQLVVSVA